MVYYMAVSAILLFFVGVIWSRRPLINLFVKVAFLTVGFWGLFTWLQAAGYVFKR